MKRDRGVDNTRARSLINSLTEREIDILRLMTQGLSNREIAEAVSLSFETVKWYNKQIYDKLGVANRVQAVSDAQALGLLQETAVKPTPSPTEKPLPRNNLPAQVTSFIGRQREVTEAQAVLETSRLLTLSGPGGSGKTRLALRLASEVMQSFPDGVYFISLTPVIAVENLLWTIAEHVGIRFLQQDAPINQLLKYFREKTLLLILDNFEHLIAGAEILTDILRAAPSVKMIVTSRERLNLYGAVNYGIGGLALPTEKVIENDTQIESVELFIRRAQAINSNLILETDNLCQIVRICRLVEGMPLGIELAATWVDVLSPKEIADEIEHNLDILDADMRGTAYEQNSMRAVFARSWNLLNTDQQIAFSRLSVFRGGFSRVSVEAVTEVGLRTLQALVNKSLLRYDPHTGRYETHELLRHYAEEQLEISGQANTIHEKYARYFADFMQDHWPQLKGHRQKIALHEIAEDIENIRAAWNYWIKEKNISELRKFLHSFWVIYDIRGWYPAGIELFERGVEVTREIATEEAQAALGWLLAAQALYCISGGIYQIGGGMRKGFNLAQQAMQVIERLNRYDEMTIIPLLSMSITASLINETGIAIAAGQECLEVATQINDGWGVAKAKQFLSMRAIKDADYHAAELLTHEALSTFEVNGDKWSESLLCIEVGSLLAITLQQFDRAKEWIERGLKSADSIDFGYSRQMAYWQLGYVAALQENYIEAAKYWQEALKIGEDVVGSPIVIGFEGSGVEWS